jgi:hypothetical protein
VATAGDGVDSPRAVARIALAAAVGLVQAYAMFAVAQPILAGRGLDVPLTDPTALRGGAWATPATAGSRCSAWAPACCCGIPPAR